MNKSYKYIKKLFLLASIFWLLGPAFNALALSAQPTPKDMAYIPPGGFTRGTDNNVEKSFSDEHPSRMVYLDAYFIDKYEVSNKSYIDFIKATDYPAPAYWDHHQLNNPNQPVTGVNWYDANAYCSWANKRLPTEAEWEKAARGPAGLKYPWSNELKSDLANYGRSNNGKIHITEPVNSYPEGVSYYHIHNMAGNVFEWVSDWYDKDYYKRENNTDNPQGPEKGQLKVIRGGSWYTPARSITTTHRFWNKPINNSYGVGLGFRCARSAETNQDMLGRSFYMDALIHLGAQKYKKADGAINKALQADPNNREYKELELLIKNKKGKGSKR